MTPRLAALAAPALVLAFGLFVLQAHSLAFWSAHAGPATGWAWSLGLEAGALWLWWRGGWARALGALATLLLLAGPLHQVSAPLVAEWRLEERAAVETVARTAALHREIAGLEAQHRTYLANSRDRLGWYDRLGETERALTQANARLRETLARPGTRDPQPGTLLVIALQALALVVFQAVNVLAVLALASRWPEMKRPSEPAFHRNTDGADAASADPETPETVQSGATPFHRSGGSETAMLPPDETVRAVMPETPAAPETPTRGYPDDLVVKRLQRAIRQHIDASGLSANRWCEQHRINKRDLSFLAHHFTRAKEGKETISAQKLDALLRRFLPPAEERTS